MNRLRNFVLASALCIPALALCETSPPDVYIALLAYEMSLDGKHPPVMDGFTGQQRVFIGYGQAWRGISRDEAVRNQINTDPHSPRQYRVNGVVRNVPEFYEAFENAKDDELYLAPEDRVKIG